jgi:beta-mannosidase
MIMESLGGKWLFRQLGTDDWLPANVPGGVHTDLMAVGRIPDPFAADNEKRVQWVAQSDWEYRTAFAPAADLWEQERVFLVCDGLDTLAEVTLNGQSLGKTENMFRQYRWEVKPLLREGENELSILFPSPVRYIAARQAERPMRGVSQAIPGGPYLRKAPCQFGWDWGPMLPPIGIWQDLRLEGRSVARLADVHLRQQHQHGAVTVTAALTVERWGDGPLTAGISVCDPEGTILKASASVADGRAQLVLPIPQPRLWWPNGYGDQPLYQVEVLLSAGGQVIDRRAFQLGLRTIELRQEDDEWGKSFTFVVNGVPIFAKGSNWIPADSFPTQLSDEHLEHLIRSAAESHQNMLRVWGGGLYEEERFYDLCDRYGILVWQDFIFSCSIYPFHEEAFLENVRVEAIENLRRLRHRAGLALWCGNNEMEQGWESWGWSKPELDPSLRTLLETLARRSPPVAFLLHALDHLEEMPGWEELKAEYKRFFHTTLPEWVAQEDPDTPYWPSSPSSNTPFHDVNGQKQGDAHYWEVWHGRRPFTAYRDQYPRFMSEFGFQSLPPLATVRTYADEADWNMTSYVMEHHQRSSGGNGLMIAQMTDTFRMPKDFPALVYLSMVLQAEGIRYGVEHWRRNMHRVSGTLYWQLNDCWPVASWSSLDYFGRWKAFHYAARRFFAPLLLSVEDAPPRMNVHVSSDLREPWEGTLHWSLETLGGEVLQAGQEAVSAAPLASSRVCALDFSERISDENARDLVFVSELRQGDRRVALVVAPFVPNKHLALVDPLLSVEVRPGGEGLVLEVTAGSLARFVELALEGADVVFSDNYFDLPAGRTLTVTAPLPPGWSVEKAQRQLRVRSLYDSFAV